MPDEPDWLDSEPELSRDLKIEFGNLNQRGVQILRHALDLCRARAFIESTDPVRLAAYGRKLKAGRRLKWSLPKPPKGISTDDSVRRGWRGDDGAMLWLLLVGNWHFGELVERVLDAIENRDAATFRTLAGLIERTPPGENIAKHYDPIRAAFRDVFFDEAARDRVWSLEELRRVAQYGTAWNHPEFWPYARKNHAPSDRNLSRIAKEFGGKVRGIGRANKIGK